MTLEVHSITYYTPSLDQARAVQTDKDRLACTTSAQTKSPAVCELDARDLGSLETGHIVSQHGLLSTPLVSAFLADGCDRAWDIAYITLPTNPASCSKTYMPSKLTMLYPISSAYSHDQFMNVRPAPRPPADRPRLALTPAINNIPGNMSAMSLNPPTPGGYNQNYNPSYSNSNTSLIPSKGNVAPFEVIKEGLAKTKEDGLMKFWSDKWLVLREAQLDFHKAQNSPKINFSISLRDVTNVSRSENHPFSFEISRVANPGGVTSPGPGGTAREVALKTVICKVETDDDVYDWIDSIYARVPGMGGVSKPTDFNHTVHVGFDATSGAFTGLPVEWARLLNASAITKEDYSRNPAAVIEVLNFYTEKLQKGDDGGPQYPVITPPVPYAGQGAQDRQLGYGQGSSSNMPNPNDYSRSQSAAGQYNEKSPAVQQTYHQLSGQKSYRDLKGDARQEESRQMQTRQQQEQQQQQQQQHYQQQQQQQQHWQNEDDHSNNQAQALRQPEIKQAGPRYNPVRAAPAPPTAKQQQPQPQVQQQVQQQSPAQRQPPPASLRTAADPAIQRMTSPEAISPQRQQSPRAQEQNNGQAAPIAKPHFPVKAQDTQVRQQAAAANAKPINVPIKQATGAAAVAELAKKAEEAPLKKPAEQAQPSDQQQKTRDQRMSTMTEAQVMQKLREVVSKDPPLQSYNKQKKIGQGASGSVYVARVRESATSVMARQVLKQQGPRAQVAIKQMDLRQQQRKELIVNEIVVMKDSKHPNIVNFIEAFLPEEQTELWVVMEFMEGGALTDVIENNPSISEDQISTISFEVSNGLTGFLSSPYQLTLPHRHAKASTTSTNKTSSTATSNPTTFSSPPPAPSKSPTSASAPSSPSRNPNAPPWSARPTGWPPKSSSRKNTAPKSTSGVWASWRSR